MEEITEERNTYNEETNEKQDTTHEIKIDVTNERENARQMQTNK